MKLILRKASVRSNGGPKGGTRAIPASDSVLKRVQFSSGIPLKQAAGTNPAELIAAAHAGSFALALSKELGRAAVAVGDIITSATVTLAHLASGWTVTNIHLNVIARLPKVTQGEFIDATVRAKTNCLVSKLMRVNISMNAKLET